MTTGGLDRIILRAGASSASGMCLAALLLTGTQVRTPPLRPPFSVTTRYGLCGDGFATCAPRTSDCRINVAESLAALFEGDGATRNVQMLAHICNVSRKTFHGWLNGATISSENERRIASVVDVLLGVAQRHRDLSSFVTTASSFGKPADYLRDGQFATVLGLAYGIEPTAAAERSSRSHPLKSIPFVRDALLGEQEYRPVTRDYVDRPDNALYREIDADMEIRPLGPAYIIG